MPPSPTTIGPVLRRCSKPLLMRVRLYSRSEVKRSTENEG
jgi:hypothetical protein